MSFPTFRLFLMGLTGAFVMNLAAAAGNDGTFFRPGFDVRIYDQSWSDNLDTDELKPVFSKTVTRWPGKDKPMFKKRAPKHGFTVFEGYLKLKKSTDDAWFQPGWKKSTAARMEIDGEVVYKKMPGENTPSVGGKKGKPIRLSRGYHTFRIIHFTPVRRLICFNPITRRLKGGVLRTKVPFEPQMQQELLSTFDALIKHITGRSNLKNDQLSHHLRVIDRHRYIFGYNREIIQAAFNVAWTFEKKSGPLWVDHKGFNQRHGEPESVKWAIFKVMQYIMDDVYTAENIERFGALLNGFAFESAKHFPGAVEPPEHPDDPYSVKINGSQPEGMRHVEQGNQGYARKPTGAYLAPGSIATVTVPRSLVNRDYRIRVGAHSSDMSHRPSVPRLYRVTCTYPIDSRTVHVANPLGGGIYVEVPYGARAGVVTVTVQNAVRSPYFSTKQFHQTSLSQWRNVERKRDAPWVDVHSEKFMMQVPTSWIDDLDDPKTLMKNWNRAVDALNYIMGLPRNRPRESLYLQVDLQNAHSVLAPGYPAVNDRYNPNKDYKGPVNHYLVQGPKHADSSVFHEKGHGFRFQKPAGEQESMVNLLHVAVMNLAFGMDLDKAFRESRRSNNEYRTLDTTAIAWMTSFNFVEGQPMHKAEKAYQLKGHARYVDVAKLFGWKPMRKFFKSMNVQNNQAREAGKNPPWSKNNDHEEYVIQLCRATGIDLRPLMHFWGIVPEDGGVLGKDTRVEQRPDSRKIYERLMHYKSLVPKNNKEFRTFARRWWGKQPSIKGNWTQREHARQWSDKKLREDRDARPGGEKYDRAAAQNVRNRVQQIIDMYYPRNRPTK